MPSWPTVDRLPDEFTCSAAAANAVFLDTNVFWEKELISRLPPALISSIVLAEVYRQNRKPHYPGAVQAYLRATGIQVVSLTAEDSAAFRILTNQMNLGARPLRFANEDLRRSTDRLRFDLLVFAVALRHNRILITNNTSDFSLFPHGDCWTTPSSFVPEV